MRKIAIALLFAILGACSDVVVDYSGTYVAEGLRLELKKYGSRYTGKLVRDGEMFAVEARSTNNEMVGEYLTGDDRFGFTACWKGKELHFTTVKDSTLLTRTTAAGAPN
jgi:hypothetical protein